MSAAHSHGGSVEPIIGRLKRVLKMEAGVFQEIGGDPAATAQAVIVVVTAALIAGLGALIGSNFSLGAWILSSIYSVVGLAIGTGIIYLVSRMFKAQGDYISLFRSLGFAYAPQALGIIPIIGFVGVIWSIILAIRAVKETQNVPNGTAVAVVLIPVAILFVIGLILVLAVGMALLGLGAAAANS
jgi:hypothetical protein